jgi:integrase
LRRCRQVFKFAVARGWIADDSTKSMKVPKFRRNQTPPFTPDEMTKILNEADQRIAVARSCGKANAIRVKTLILFMRFSGLRIGDAISCKVEWVRDGRISRFTQKNNRHINVELPVSVIRALARCPKESQLFWFWSEKSGEETAKIKYQKLLFKLFADAGIKRGHSHRFRDTFAVAMLDCGESIQTVANANGDTLAVAQAHYNPWSQRRQSRLNEAVRAAWEGDPLLRILDEQETVGRVAERAT